MREIKFKLKKDGKCVGYLRWSGRWLLAYVPGASGTAVRLQDDAVIDVTTGVVLLHFDSLHPFVCLDRNGKEVYCDDWVLSVAENEPGIVVMFDQWHQWCVRSRLGFKTVWQCIDEQGIEFLDPQPEGEQA